MSKPAQPVLVRFYGVRGSYPVTGPCAAGYGGNTPCVAVYAGGERIVFDAGTGIISLGRALAHRAEAGHVRLFFTHFHYDHILGLPFFEPLYQEQTSIDFFGPGAAGMPFEKNVRRIVDSPVFPLSLEETKVKKKFAQLSHGNVVTFDKGKSRVTSGMPRTSVPGCVRVEAYAGKHPSDGVMAYAVSHGGKRIVFATDVECTLQDVSSYCRFVAGADLLIHDTQYLDASYLDLRNPRKGWGHSTVEMVCVFARECGVGNLVLFHHDPLDSAKALRHKEKIARKMFGRNVRAARENLQILLG